MNGQSLHHANNKKEVSINMPAGNITGIALGRNLQAWHGLGIIKQGLMTASEAAEAADLLFTVERVPLYAHLNGQSILAKDPDEMTTDPKTGEEKVVPGRQPFALIRTDKKIVLTTDVTKRYKILQPSTAFQIVDELTGANGAARFDVAGQFNYGKRIWMLCAYEDSISIAGDEIKKYFLLVNGYDGKTTLMALNTPIRVVCQNTLNAALREAERAYKMRHIGDNMEPESIKAAVREIVQATQGYYDAFEADAQTLVAQKVTANQVNTLVTEVLFPMPEDPSKRGETLINKARELVYACMDKEDLANVKGTAWGVYNAVADYSDHLRILKGADQMKALERTFTRTFEGTDLKDETLAYLRAIA